MKILFTICGRAGSKGIKNKNIKEFLGIPLPVYTLAAIDLYIGCHSEHQSDIVLNTDSPGLKEILEKCRKNVKIINRTEELAGDSVSKIDVIYNSMETMEKEERCRYDLVVDLDITSPLRTVGDIGNVIKEKQKKMYDVVFSITDSRRNPFFNMVKKIDDCYEKVIDSNYNARQEAPEIYDMNASIYAYSPSFLKQGKNIFEGNCGAVKMYDTGILDLDHENDFELMQVVAEYLFRSRNEFKEIYVNAQQIYGA